MERNRPDVDETEHLTDEDKAELERDAAARNPDRVTRREAMELDLMEEGESEAGEEIGDEID